MATASFTPTTAALARPVLLACGISEGPTSLAGCCYRRLARLIPDLIGLVDETPGHTRQSAASAGETLTLRVMAVQDHAQFVDIDLSSASVGNTCSSARMGLRIHFLGDRGYVEVRSAEGTGIHYPAPIPRDVEHHLPNALKNTLTRVLSLWLKDLLDQGHRLAPYPRQTDESACDRQGYGTAARCLRACGREDALSR